jgi:transcriptional regulator GlxA family with amidase domain
MTEIDRRNAAFLGLLAPLAVSAGAARAGATDARDIGPAAGPVDHIAMLVYPHMTALDLIGPHHMFSSILGARVHLVARTMEPVTSDSGVTIAPTATFQTCPRDVTVLFAPGGSKGVFAAMEDARTRAFMADRGARAKYVTSVCTGSLILAAAGLLTGYKATSHWTARDRLADFGAIPTDARVVRDRNRITGAGVTAGLDFGLAMVAELRGEAYARDVQLFAEYAPEPAFDSGSAHAASPDTLASLHRELEPHTDRISAIARSLRFMV